MKADDERENINERIKIASQEAGGLLDLTFNKLKETATKTEGPIDKLFPNGVELIYIKVEGGLTDTTKVTVELKIAGEKGIKDAITTNYRTEQVESPRSEAN